MNSNKWSLHTRFLHMGMAFTVTAQLFISLIMEEPGDKGSVVEHFAFSLHEIVGFTALSIVLLHWVWSIFENSAGNISHLFPWDKAGRDSVMADIRGLTQFKLAPANKKGGLAGLVHGLGLIVVTGAAISGAGYYLLNPGYGEAGFLAESFEELHEGLATLVWVYWVGHVSAAVLHQIMGHKIVDEMFSFNDKSHLDDKQSKVSYENNDELKQH